MTVLQQEGATALWNMGVSETKQSHAFTQPEGRDCDHSSWFCPEEIQEEFVWKMLSEYFLEVVGIESQIVHRSPQTLSVPSISFYFIYWLKLKGNKAYYANTELIKSKFLKRNTKMKIDETIIRPVVKYSSETWTLTTKDEKT